jgi:class 3 adenylate cyclase
MRAVLGHAFGLVGDVVNTAARLQQHAPVGSIVVSESTYRATRPLFEYEALEPVQAKGKAKALSLWQVVAARHCVADRRTRARESAASARELISVEASAI